MKKAPFTPEEVAALQTYQDAGIMHPFTCGNRDDGKHPDSAVLIPTEAGWICAHCDYTQNWAHDFMLIPITRRPNEQIQ